MGVATGCGCKEVYRYPHTTYPYSSCICLQQHPYFLFNFFNVFLSCSRTFFNYILGMNFFSRSINTYRQLRASHGIHMKAAHTFYT